MRTLLLLLSQFVLADAAALLRNDRVCTKGCKRPAEFADLATLPTYVINLDRRPDRWQAVQANLAQFLGSTLDRVPGVDGRQLDASLLDVADPEGPEVGPAHEVGLTTPGAVGCYLAHTHAWQNFLDSDANYALMLEDDAYFDDQSAASFNAAMSEVADAGGANWDAVNLGLLKRGPHATGAHSERLQDRFFGSHAFVASRPFAEHMLQNAFPMRYHVDQYIGLELAKHPELQVYSAPTVAKQLLMGSDIHPGFSTPDLSSVVLQDGHAAAAALLEVQQGADGMYGMYGAPPPTVVSLEGTFTITPEGMYGMYGMYGGPSAFTTRFALTNGKLQVGHIRGDQPVQRHGDSHASWRTTENNAAAEDFSPESSQYPPGLPFAYEIDDVEDAAPGNVWVNVTGSIMYTDSITFSHQGEPLEPRYVDESYPIPAHKTMVFKPEHRHKVITLNAGEDPIVARSEVYLSTGGMCGAGLFSQPRLTCSTVGPDAVDYSIMQQVPQRAFGMELEMVARKPSLDRLSGEVPLSNLDAVSACWDEAKLGVDGMVCNGHTNCGLTHYCAKLSAKDAGEGSVSGTCLPRNVCEDTRSIDGVCPHLMGSWRWETDCTVRAMTQQQAQDLAAPDVDSETDGVPFEMVSALPPNALKGNSGVRSVLEVLTTLNQMGVQAGPTQGMHIHVNVGKPGKPGDPARYAAEGANLSPTQIANVWVAYARFQNVIDEMLQDSRIGNQWAKPLRFASFKLLKDSDRPARQHVTGAAGERWSDEAHRVFKNLWEWVARVKSGDQQDDKDMCNAVLGRTFNHTCQEEGRWGYGCPCSQRYPQERYSHVNLAVLDKYGTLEFRAFPASHDPRRVAEWTQFILHFVETMKDKGDWHSHGVEPLPEGASLVKRVEQLEHKVEELQKPSLKSEALLKDFKRIALAQNRASMTELETELGIDMSFWRQRTWIQGPACGPQPQCLEACTLDMQEEVQKTAAAMAGLADTPVDVVAVKPQPDTLASDERAGRQRASSEERVLGTGAPTPALDTPAPTPTPAPTARTGAPTPAPDTTMDEVAAEFAKLAALEVEAGNNRVRRETVKVVVPPSG